MMRKFKAQIHTELLKRLDLKRLVGTNNAATKSLQEKVRATVASIVEEIKDQLPASIAPAQLTREIIQEAIGLGPLDDLLDDNEITEIMVNGPDKVYVERRGKIQLTERSFVDDAQVLAIIERIVAPIGKRIDESSPYVDARLADGSRVNAIIAPLSLKGPTITIRKFAKTPFTVADLIRFGTMTDQIADFMRICVLLRKNIIISGGTGSGKTTLLNVLSNYLPKDERIVTIEDTAELRLNQPHVVSLEARPANIEGRGAVTIRDLVRNALRMRPDRIVVGECRGGESLDMLQAMNTGHDGSLTTVHSNSPRDTISRMETMVLMAGMDLPSRAIREQIAAAVDIICHTDRLSDGTRRVTKISEVTGMEKDVIVMQDMFIFKQTGLDPKGKVLGYFTATGSVPTFIDEVRIRGLQLDRSVFTQQTEPTS
jgi:pilus assembly protein CpaF